MPYRAEGAWVMVFKAGRWVRYYLQKSAEAAQKHAAALNVAVKH